MLPISASSQIFEPDQTPCFEATYWDTPFTVPSQGVEFALFDLLGTFDPTIVGRSQIETTLLDQTKCNSVLGYSAGVYRKGVVPHIYAYWGAGAPPGGTLAKRVGMKFSGVVKATGQVTLVFGGQGSVRAYVTRAADQSVETLVEGVVHEPNVRSVLETFENTIDITVIEREWGYLVKTVTLNKGDRLDIYYWHFDEDWGGIFCKAIPGTATTNSDAFLEELRSAAVVGASYLGKEEDGEPLGGIPVRYLEEVEITREVGSVAEATLTVALTRSEERIGYQFISQGGQEYLLDNEDFVTRLNKGRLIQVKAGYRRPDGTDELYERFTGYIDDIVRDGTQARILCRSFEGLMSEVSDENHPDRLAYHANGFIFREYIGEPVYPIPAFDAWPLELAIAELALRAGIDSYNLGRSPVSADPDHAHRKFLAASTGESYNGARYFAARLLADNSTRVQMEKPSNYGNVGHFKRDHLPNDDEYLFTPEVTRTVYDRARELADHYGYDFLTHPNGQLVLAARNNPVRFEHFTDLGDPDEKVAASAVGGRYLFKQHSVDGTGWSEEIEGYFSRLDLYVGLGVDPDTGLNGGMFSYTVEQWNGADWVAVSGFPQVFSTRVLNTPEGFYYDDYVRDDGTNAAVVTLFSLPFDRYRVTISPVGPDGGDVDCVYRLNGVAVFETDPNNNVYPHPLSTLENTLDVKPESNFPDLRNHVIVVGKRKATVTDSAKFENTQQNPNNADQEFHVAVAADPFSIYDPTSPNFVGSKRMTVIFDDRVSDFDFARWLARTVLYRFRTPKSAASFEHTAIPVMELRDPVLIEEERFSSLGHVLYVTRIRETWKDGEARSSIDTVSYPEIPSYQPREDVPVDALYDHDGDGRGEPVINLRVSYRNLYGLTVTNEDLRDDVAIKGFFTREVKDNRPMVSTPVVFNAGGTKQTLSHPAIPETMYLSWNVTRDIPKGRPVGDLFYKRILVNHPYRHFWQITDWSSSKLPTVEYDFQEGDGTAGVYDMTYYGFPSNGLDQWYINYDYLKTRTGKNPYYDPYTSELGNLISIKFDALVSGRYRVSIWDANRAEGYETPVAWLTAPTNDPEDPEAHWVYLDFQADVEFLWDGVDNIGFWNQLQSFHYAKIHEGAFGDKAIAVGAGFYVWNDQSTNLHTLIGDMNSSNFDSNNQPYFTIGRFGQFYVKIEVMADRLIKNDIKAGFGRTPRTVNSDNLPAKDSQGAPLDWHSTDKVFIWTHLGEPTQVTMQIEDWDDSAGLWTPGNNAGWVTSPDPEASIRDGKPVRIKFTPLPRRGPLFGENEELTSVRLTRQVHLKATIFDQFWTFFGRPWQGVDARNEWAEEKRVTSRMFHNDEHTVEWEDENWRSGKDIKLFEWVFQPSFFKKDFGSGVEEILRYGDYEQLESMPGWNPRNTGGTSRTDRAYLTMAYINYLFYLSAFVMDRSGRRQWCINPNFQDTSKIQSPGWLNPDVDKAPHYKLSYERAGAENYLIRTIVARQWKDPAWATGGNSRSPVALYSITDPHQLKFVQPKITDFDPYSGKLVHPLGAGAPANTRDHWMEAWWTNNSWANQWIRAKGRSDLAGNPTMYQHENHYVPLSFGNWTFDRGGLVDWFRPSPCRDFHPYWRYPFMPDWLVLHTDAYTVSDGDEVWSSIEEFFSLKYVQGVLTIPSSQVTNRLRDPAAQENWFGLAFAHNEADSNAFHGAVCEYTVQAWAEKSKQALFPFAFDYQKQDDLDRFDQFRGVLSRGPYARRDKPAASWTSNDRTRASAVQPVAPSGVYFLNLGVYDEYVVSPIHQDMPHTILHYVGTVKRWYDIRFRYEYVWYNDRYFPVDGQGAAVYCFFRNEYTKAKEHTGPFWWVKRDEETFRYGSWLRPHYRFERNTDDSGATSPLFYDPGAWVGWKDDVPHSEDIPYDESGQLSDVIPSWSSRPFLRWSENVGSAIGAGEQNSVSSPWASGLHTSGSTGQDVWVRAWIDRTRVYRRTNIFDEHATHGYMRLAVGRRTPENVNLVMNLTLPSRLRA